MINDVQLNAILEKSAEYVAATQPLLDKQAAQQQSWNVQAQRTAAVLADRGCLRREVVGDFVDKIAANPCYALEYMEKLARLVTPPQLGGPSDIVKQSGKVDPFVRAYMPEYVQAGNGLVD
jgi:hypothetical protein